MGRHDFDDSELNEDEYPDGSREHIRKRRKQFDDNEKRVSPKGKKSDNRSHLKKKSKEDFWIEKDD